MSFTRLKVFLRVALVLLALFSSLVFFAAPGVQGVSLGEYAFLFEPPGASSWQYLLHAKSCDGFLHSLELSTVLVEDKDYAPALAAALNARDALREAAAFALLQKLSPLGPSPGGWFYYNWFSYKCFSRGADALASAEAAVKASFKPLDDSIASLEFASTSEYSGSAGGVLNELSEALADVRARRADGNGFGRKFVASVNSANLVSRAFDLATASSSELFSVVDSLVGRNSFLTESVLLRERVVQALDSLYSENEDLQRDFNARLVAAKRVLEESRAEKLFLVGSGAFQLVGAGSVLTSEYKVASFEEELEDAQALVEDAQSLEREASLTFSRKRAGFLAKSILLLREAVGKTVSAKQSLDSVMEKSLFLESALRDRVLREQQNLRAAIDVIRASNPYAAARAQVLLEKDYNALSQALRTRGERIAFFLSEATELIELQKTALSSQAGTMLEKQEVLGELASVKRLIAEAEKDELELNFEKQRVAAIETAVKQLGDDAQSAESLEVLKNDLKLVRDGIIAQAVEKYSLVLADYFTRVKAFEQLLSQKEKIEFAGVERFFDAFGTPKIAESIGSLKTVKNSLEKLLASIELMLPVLLKRNLEENARVSTRFELVELGKPTRVVLRAVFVNTLPYSYDKQLLLQTRELKDFLSNFENVKVLEKSGELSVSREGVLLNKLEENKEYFVELEKNVVLAEKTSVTEQTVSASESRAVKRETVFFNFVALQNGLVLVKRVLPFPVELARVDSNTVNANVERTANSSVITLLVSASPGQNKAGFEYEIVNPVRVTRLASVNGNTIELNYSFTTTFASLSLDNVEINVLENLECSVKKLSIITTIPFESSREQNLIAIRFKTSLLTQTPQTALLRAECDSLEQAARAKLEQLKQLLAQLENEITLEDKNAIQAKLSTAENAISNNNYANALQSLLEAENLIRTAQEKALQRKNLAIEAEKELNRAVILSTQLRNASTTLITQGNTAQANSLLELVKEAETIITRAKQLIATSEYTTALSELRALNARLSTALEDHARVELERLLKKCDDARKACTTQTRQALQNAASLIAANALLDAFNALSQAETLLTQSTSDFESERMAKKGLMESYSQFKQGVEEAVNAFVDAFSVPQELVGERRKSLLFQEGSVAKSKVERLLKKLDVVWSAFETGDEAFERYSLAFLNESFESLVQLRDVLVEKTNLVKLDAERELETARERVKQFGGDVTRRALERAESAFAANNFFTAFVIASEVNRALVGVPSASVVEEQQESWKLVLAFVGLVILFALAYFIVLRDKTPKKKKLPE